MTYSTASHDGANRHDYACWGFIGLSVIIAGVAFHASGQAYLAAVGLAFMLFSISQLSGALSRLKLALEGRHWFTAGFVILLTLIFMGAETLGVHYGLQHINAAHGLIPVEYEWHASAGASLINLLGSYAFARDLETTTTATAPAETHVIEAETVPPTLIDLSDMNAETASKCASYVGSWRHHCRQMQDA